MATYKNTADYTVSIPVLGLNVPAGETFTVPDEFSDQFDANPIFASSKVKNADVQVDPSVAEAVTNPNPATGPIGVVPPFSAATAPATPDHVIQ